MLLSAFALQPNYVRMTSGFMYCDWVYLHLHPFVVIPEFFLIISIILSQMKAVLFQNIPDPSEELQHAT